MPWGKDLFYCRLLTLSGILRSSLGCSTVSYVKLETVLKSVDGDTGAPRTKVQQLAKFLLIHLSDNLPKPFDYLVVFVVGSLIIGVIEPVFDIYEGQSIQEHLHFVCIEYGEKLYWNYFVEGVLNSSDVVGYTLCAVVVHTT